MRSGAGSVPALILVLLSGLVLAWTLENEALHHSPQQPFPEHDTDKAHPYGNPVLGWPEDMANLTREDALSFYRQGYGTDPGYVAKAVDLELQTLSDKGPSADAVARAQQNLKTKATLMSEDLIPGTALLIGTALTTGLTLDDLKEWP
jgi:predicted Zn-dependent peptidase